MLYVLALIGLAEGIVSIMTVSYACRVLSEPCETRMPRITSEHVAIPMTSSSNGQSPMTSLYPNLFEASAPSPMTQEEAP